MAVKLPARKYYTFPEVETLLGCTETDLKRLVIDGDISPSYHIRMGDYRACAMASYVRQDDSPSGFYPRPIERDGMGSADRFRSEPKFGLHHLICPQGLGPVNCEFRHFSDQPRDHELGDRCHELESAIDMAGIFEQCVVTAAEIARLQLQFGETDSPANHAEKRWPWGTHHTVLLGHLEAAAARFWTAYDPKFTKTAPTNLTVSGWLKTERKVSGTMAIAIATMLRADKLPFGPRK